MQGSIVFSQALRYNLLIADDTLLQKEHDSLAVSLLARQYLLENITCNISKALHHSCNTLLHSSPKAASPKTVLPIVTPYSPEGRHSPSQYRTVGILLRMILNYKTSAPTIPSLLTTEPNQFLHIAPINYQVIPQKAILIPYMAQAHHPFQYMSFQNVLPFCNYTSSTSTPEHPCWLPPLSSLLQPFTPLPYSIPFTSNGMLSSRTN